MLIPLTPNRLIVFRHVLLTYSYRPAGDRLVLQTWHMFGPFAPDPLDEENCESARRDSGRAPARHLADVPSAREQFRPARLSRRVRWWYGHGDKGLSGTFRHLALYCMADEHEALGLGLSYTCHGAFCTANELYHFVNVFFKIGKDEARLMSLSQRVLLETGYEILQLFVLWFHFCELRYSLSVLSGGYFICLFLLLLGLTSAKSRRHVPSKGSSEPLSESLSKLSSHQIPHSLGSEGSTTAKGLYAYSFFVLNHYAFGGVREQALSVFVLSTSTTESSRRVPPPRGSRLAVPARGTPFVFLELARWLRSRRFHARWIRCRRPVSGTGPLALRL